jgi:hypothetical protein
LVKNHYPRLVETTYSTQRKTPEEIVESFVNSNNSEMLKVVKHERLWRIERVIVKLDNFILVDEDSGDQFLWKMNSPCTFFLKKYRSGGFKSLEEAWNEFVSKSELIHKIEIKE